MKKSIITIICIIFSALFAGCSEAPAAVAKPKATAVAETEAATTNRKAGEASAETEFGSSNCKAGEAFAETEREQYATGDTVYFKVTNNAEREVCFGEDYGLEVKNGEKWENADLGERAIHDILYSVQPGKTSERFGFLLEYGEGPCRASDKFPVGEYRLIIHCYFGGENSDSKNSFDLYAGFRVTKDAYEAQKVSTKIKCRDYSEGETLVFTLVNRSDHEIYYGYDYGLEYNQGDRWTVVDRGNIAISSVLASLDAKDKKKEKFSLAKENIFADKGKLDPGEYRLALNFSFDEGMARKDLFTAYTKFKINK